MSAYRPKFAVKTQQTAGSSGGDSGTVCCEPVYVLAEPVFDEELDIVMTEGDTDVS